MNQVNTFSSSDLRTTEKNFEQEFIFQEIDACIFLIIITTPIFKV